MSGADYKPHKGAQTAATYVLKNSHKDGWTEVAYSNPPETKEAAKMRMADIIRNLFWRPKVYHGHRNGACPAGCMNGDYPVKFKHCKEHYGKVR